MIARSPLAHPPTRKHIQSKRLTDFAGAVAHELLNTLIFIILIFFLFPILESLEVKK
jgi:hypothetical protein